MLLIYDSARFIEGASGRPDYPSTQCHRSSAVNRTRYHMIKPFDQVRINTVSSRLTATFALVSMPLRIIALIAIFGQFTPYVYSNNDY